MAQLMRLEHRILEQLRRRDIKHQPILIALSGGLDSVALLNLLYYLRPFLSLNLFVGHIHHGWIHGEQGQFRNDAWRFCQKLCAKFDIPFYSNLIELRPEPRFLIEPEVTLKSEEDMRNFRYTCLNNFLQQLSESSYQKVLLATAHTADDQLETRLIHLIRGAGHKGVEAMSFLNEEILRPLILCSRQELKDYLKERKSDYIDDPSNLSLDPFRNWIRNEWLVQLEKKRPGSVNSLSRSLRLLTEEKNSSTQWLDEQIAGDSIKHDLFLELNFNEKKRVLAYYMRKMNMKNYSQNHILEVIKRLDSPEKEHKFILLKHDWTVNAQQIKASPV
ncbi:MAG: tRNA lysidine(34) synthetase TilS [Bdellovibrionales bacterium]|nr:tRNA lysidine(34) synthetase TilS [Bdellovibrionales bacterium]